jgi:hypothetical protein
MTTALENIRARAAREALANAQHARRKHLISAGATSAVPIEYHGPLADET